MQKFITTITLDNADEKDFRKLELELEKDQFVTGHATDAGRRAFKRVGDVRFDDVVRSIARAIAKTGKEYSFTITTVRPGAA